MANECSICLDGMNDPETVVLHCSPGVTHTFHKVCAHAVFKAAGLADHPAGGIPCPLCRALFSPKITKLLLKSVNKNCPLQVYSFDMATMLIDTIQHEIASLYVKKARLHSRDEKKRIDNYINTLYVQADKVQCCL